MELKKMKELPGKQTDRSRNMTKGEETRQRILSRAARLLNEKGYFGVTLSDLMRATGLKKGGLYNHFESKEKLALAAFDYALALYRARFERALRDKTHAGDRLLAIVEVFQSCAIDPPLPGGCIIMNTAIESDDSMPALRERAKQGMESLRKRILRTVEAGIQAGEIRRDADPEQAAGLIIATLEGGVMMSKLYRDTVHVERVMEYITRYINENLRAQAINAR